MHRLSSLFLVLLVSALALAPGRASAFPWMIHHGYTGCAQCHVDPSGAGILTDYGRGQSEILLKSNYGKEPKNPEKVSSFLFGAVTLPKQLEVQADVRDIVIPEPGNVRIILMQADARAALAVGPFIASGSIGTVSEGAELAQISSNDTGFKLVSREYWVGAIPTKGLTIRAGRMNLPFGIRTEDHVLFVRSATSTTINDDQQVGLAVAYGNKKMRGEIMGIAGNFQVSPDDFRKRRRACERSHAAVPMGFQRLYQRVPVCPRNGLFARSINIRNNHMIGIVEAGGKLFEQRMQSRIAMRLDDGDHLPGR